MTNRTANLRTGSVNPLLARDRCCAAPSAMTNKLEFDDAPRQFSSLNIMGGGDGKTSDAKQRSEKKPSGPKIVEISDDG